MSLELPLHQHGKSRVKVARTWRVGDTHHFVEWQVATMLESAMEPAFKEVSKAKIMVEQKPWARVHLHGQPHEHGETAVAVVGVETGIATCHAARLLCCELAAGYSVTGTEVRTCYVTFDRAGQLEVTGGLKDMQVLKTTQSGYEGFLHDEFTGLPDCTDRILATSMTSSWKYSRAPACYDAAFDAVKQAVSDGFFGPVRGGVYSPSMQSTLWGMGQLIMARVPEVVSVFFNTPNLHFLPCAPKTSTFKDDVYVATSEPHGDIQCVITRGATAPHLSKL
ncbi:hypothetical protein QJQ45_020612 [Haematococcus lacustris]|nr:hypothetical protein QJQ45_020612 [Haematococcus lacustris]